MLIFANLRIAFVSSSNNNSSLLLSTTRVRVTRVTCPGLPKLAHHAPSVHIVHSAITNTRAPNPHTAALLQTQSCVQQTHTAHAPQPARRKRKHPLEDGYIFPPRPEKDEINILPQGYPPSRMLFSFSIPGPVTWTRPSQSSLLR